jgi:hypothetical protein
MMTVPWSVLGFKRAKAELRNSSFMAGTEMTDDIRGVSFY